MHELPVVALRRILLVTVLFVGACKDKQPAPSSASGGSAIASGATIDGAPAGSSTVDATESACAAQARELKGWIAAVVDPAQKVAPPWPTGDAAFDKDLETLRATARELAKPPDPSQKAKPLSEGLKPGKLDHELASCAVAKVRLAEIGSADDKPAAWSALADAIAACDCEPEIPRIKALLYLIHRGAD